MIEFLYLFGKKLNGLGFFMCFVCGFSVVIYLIALGSDAPESFLKPFRISVGKIILFFIVGLLFMVVPIGEDVIKARIGRVKYELLNQANINSGLSEIQRIGRKLECKYLGCDEDNEK